MFDVIHANSSTQMVHEITCLTALPPRDQDDAQECLAWAVMASLLFQNVLIPTSEGGIDG